MDGGRGHRRLWLISLLVGVVAGSAVLWAVLRSDETTTVEAPNRSESVPVLVYLLSPTNATSLVGGDSIDVVAQAAAADGVAATEVVIDGVSLGAVEGADGNASWEWLAWPPGVHTIQALATDSSGETGRSPTLVVNVLAPPDDLVVVPAEGESLSEVAAGYGVDVEVVAAANPQHDPADSLSPADSVRLPVADWSPPLPDETTTPVNVQAVTTTWTLRPTALAEQSYCYVSAGDRWDRIPSEPFRFFGGDGDAEYVDIGRRLVRSRAVLSAECWSWVDGVLNFLGGGEASEVYRGDPDGAMVTTDAFTLVGRPEVPIPDVPLAGGSAPPGIAPPFAVREAADTSECTQHHGNLLAGFICDALLNEPVKQHMVLVWEWSPAQCWAVECVDDIDGYRVYQLPASGPPTELGQVTNPGQRALAVPRVFPGVCYGVEAYSDDPSVPASTITEFCPGDPPEPSTISVGLQQWLTVGGSTKDEGDCENYGTGRFTGFGRRVLVGSTIVDDEDGDCYRASHYDALLAFETLGLPAGAVVQSAKLEFDVHGSYYGATALATNLKPFCASAVRRADTDWTASVPASHWLASISFPPAPQVATVDLLSTADVTSAVERWVKSPGDDHGLMIVGRSAPHPAADGSGECLTYFDGATIDVTYFVP